MYLGKKFFIGITVAVLISLAASFLYFYDPYTDRVILVDTSLPQNIVIESDENAGYPDSIKIKVSGNILGDAVLSLMMDGEPGKDEVVYRKKAVSGDFSFVWKSDWYSSKIKILYRPSPGTSGSVEIRAMFNTISSH